jgi:hypothetical protein
MTKSTRTATSAELDLRVFFVVSSVIHAPGGVERMRSFVLPHRAVRRTARQRTPR